MALGSYRRVQAEREAHAQFTRASQKAQAAEARRRQQLADHRQQYDRWAAEQLIGIRAHNRGLNELAGKLRAGEADAVVEYFSAALYASTAWPEELPRQVSAAYDQAARQLVLDWELPRYGVVPEAKSVRYLPSIDQDKETARPAAQRRALYRDLLAQCLLLVVRELYAADEFGALDSVVVNGFVDDHDPATGREAQIILAMVSAAHSAFTGLRLEQVSAVDCLVSGLGGQLSARPDQLTAVRPGRRPDEVGGGVVSHGGPAGDADDEPDLFAMDPIDFENLVAELFRAMGMEAVTTQRSGDGGVDVEALDPAPIRGGRIVVQVKRYRNTVPPTAVRDLYGTVQDKGANKGVLVTTASFGPGSYTFANGKPLELVPGADLVELLHQYGLRGRLGGGAPTPAAPRAAGGRDGARARVSGGPQRTGHVLVGVRRARRVRAGLRGRPGAERGPLRLLQQPAEPGRFGTGPGARAARQGGSGGLLRRAARARRPSGARRRDRPGGRPAGGPGRVHRRAHPPAVRGRRGARPAGGLRRPRRRDRAGPRFVPAPCERRLGLRDRRQGLPRRPGGPARRVRRRGGVRQRTRRRPSPQSSAGVSAGRST
ncbi:mrr restriction system protein [Streptomyces sp. Mg1]|nr:mrr restriction system protein [Streptomyces sp. Mg1]